MPLASATPISILARESATCGDRVRRGPGDRRRRDTFVSESLPRPRNATGGRRSIEKTPRRTVALQGRREYLICTNHYQSEASPTTGTSARNIALPTAPSFARLEELMAANATPQLPQPPMLRDLRRHGRKDSAWGTTVSVNHRSPHHSAYSSRQPLQMLVTTSPVAGRGAYVSTTSGDPAQPQPRR